MAAPTPSDTRSAPAGVPEEELHALVDGRLDAAARTALERRVAADPQAQATLQAWQRQREALRGLHAGLAQEPAPPAMAAAARTLKAREERLRQAWRLGGLAASVLLAFGLGWVAHGRLAGQQLAAAAPRPAVAEFAHQASVAHLVYAPEQRHPVEVGAAEQAHLVQWLSRRLGRPLKVPDLRAEGFELVGGRLLPGGEGARAQFMFQDAAGLRITLYLGGLAAGEGGAPASGAAGPAAGTSARETAFGFAADGPVPGFYWMDQGFGYALAGPLPRERLLALARRVYELLQG